MTSQDASPSGHDPLAQNLILHSLPRQERERMAGEFSTLRYRRGHILHHAGDPASVVYFPTRGMVSAVIELEDGDLIETGIIGAEGMAGLAGCLGLQRSALTLMAATDGEAFRIRSDSLRRHMLRMPVLHDILLRYVGFTLSTTDRAIACTRFHSVEQRCARRLLAVRDRTGSDSLQLTQDFVASMLGVRRASVTAAIRQFHLRGLVESRRGRLRIVDATELQAAACSCYQAVNDAFQDILVRP